MRRSLVSIVLSLLSLSFVSAEEAPAPHVTLDDFTELLKLHKDQIPLVTFFARPFIRISPKGDRYIYIRMYHDKAIPHIGQFKPVKSDKPVAWGNCGIATSYCRMCFAGIVWRADGKQVLFLHPRSEEGRKKGWVEHYERSMFPYAMRWDLRPAQFGYPKYFGFANKGATGCTSASFSPDGKVLWAAYSDHKDFKACGVTECPQGRRPGRILYRNTGAAIYHLVPSPDGKHLAWVETHIRKTGTKYQGPVVVIFNVKTKKVVHRIGLSQHIPSWSDVQPPVWTADSKAICYGDVVEIDRVYRREVRVLGLEKKAGRVLVRDALAVGAIPGGIILNYGPGCTPTRQQISSYISPGAADDRPQMNNIILCSLTGKTPPQTLVSNAYCQQIIGDRVIYAQRNADQVLVMQARLKRPKPSKSRKVTTRPKP